MKPRQGIITNAEPIFEVMKTREFHPSAGLALLLCLLVSPTWARGQQLARQALTIFPAGTQEMAYTSLAELRSLPDYGQVRGALFSRQMFVFDNFLRSLGIDPEKDVDEAVVGWRGGPGSNAPLFGLAQGRFEPGQTQNFITQESLPTQQYAGYTLNACGPGLSSQDLFFTFFDRGLAAFGSLNDLKALIDDYLGRGKGLDSNRDFVNWEAGLEGSGPEWGITTGKAALNMAMPWLLGASTQKSNLESVLGPIKAVLYQANWDNGFSAEISIVCQNDQSAHTLAQLLSLWRDSTTLTGKKSPGVTRFIQGLQIDSSGSTVEMDGSGSSAVFTQLFQNAVGH